METHDLRAKKILVVEDDQALRDLYMQILTEAHCIVDVAQNGEIAYEKMSAQTYDLILLDIILPKLDGLQILEKLDFEGRLKGKNIVILSNLGQDMVIAKAMSFGVRGYMIKSNYTPTEMLREIKEYML